MERHAVPFFHVISLLMDTQSKDEGKTPAIAKEVLIACKYS